MLMTAFGLLPAALGAKIATVSVINDKVIIPAGKKIATGITTGLGLLTQEEAREQEQIFDDFIKPAQDVMKDM